MQVQEVDGGFRVILSQTAKAEEATGALVGVSSPLIQSMEALAARRGSPRARRARDGRQRVERRRATSSGAARRATSSATSGSTTSTWCPPTAAPRRAARARRARRDRRGRRLGLRRRSSTSACASRSSPRRSRARSRRAASFTDPYLRTAMKRLGEVSPGGRIAMADGSSFNAGSSIELTAAMSQPGDALGYLALLRSLRRQGRAGRPAPQHAARPRRARGRLRPLRIVRGRRRAGRASVPGLALKPRTHSAGPGGASRDPDPRSPPRRRAATRPRERLAALGAEALSDAELVALLLRTGAPSVSARDAAQALLRRHGGLRGLARAPLAELARRARHRRGEGRHAPRRVRARPPRREPAAPPRRSDPQPGRRAPPLPSAAPRRAARALPRRAARRAAPRDPAGAHVAGHAHREPRPPARGVRARAPRAGGRDRARPQPPERRPDPEPGGSRGDHAAGGGGGAPGNSGARPRRRGRAGLREPPGCRFLRPPGGS